MFGKAKPKISVCIPVYGTEKRLSACLESVAKQGVSGVEIVVVDDGSDALAGRENGKAVSAEQIVRSFCKSRRRESIAVNFIRHEKNKGSEEARRTAVYEARGDFVLFLDSDDTLPPGAASVLYETAVANGADIVHGTMAVQTRGADAADIERQKRVDAVRRKARHVFFGTLDGEEILDGFLVRQNHTGFLCGKLFTRELCLEAFEKIPPVYCAFGEDFLTYVFLAHFAQKYVGIENAVYNYDIDAGISSRRQIATLEKWRRVCSVASVFTILLTAIRSGELDLTEAEIQEINNTSHLYAANNLQQLNGVVVPELRERAYEELCDWWGRDMMEKTERLMKEQWDEKRPAR